MTMRSIYSQASSERSYRLMDRGARDCGVLRCSRACFACEVVSIPGLMVHCHREDAFD